jgi:hypothetical protein
MAMMQRYRLVRCWEYPYNAASLFQCIFVHSYSYAINERQCLNR